MDPKNKEELETARGKLQKAVAQFKGKIESPNQDALETQFEQIRDLVAEMSGLIYDSAGEIDEFFTAVGDGLFKAQVELDKKSLEYERARPDIALPVAYRIPKVKAEIKFAMTKEKSKKFSVLVFGTKSTKSETMQNSVSFEVTTAPPPPEFMEGLSLGAGFITNPDQRQGIFDELKSWPLEGLKKQAVNRIASNKKTLILINNESNWLFVLPLKDKEIMEIIRGNPEKKEVFPTNPTANPTTTTEARIREIYKFLNVISIEQETLLKKHEELRRLSRPQTPPSGQE